MELVTIVPMPMLICHQEHLMTTVEFLNLSKIGSITLMNFLVIMTLI